MVNTDNSPDKFLAMWQRRLQMQAFVEGAVFGMATAAVAIFLIVLVSIVLVVLVVLVVPRIGLDWRLSIPWTFFGLLLAGLCGGLIKARTSKFSLSRVARIVDRANPANCGRFIAWVELEKELPQAWRCAMHRELAKYLANGQISELRRVRSSNLKLGAWLIFAAFTGSVALLQWNHSRSQSLQLGISKALDLVENATSSLLPVDGPTNSAAPDSIQDDFFALVQHGRESIEQSQTAQEAESIATAIVKELERRIAKNKQLVSPALRAALVENKKNPISVEDEASHSKFPDDALRKNSTAEGNLAQIPAGLQEEKETASSMLQKLFTLEALPVDLANFSKDSSDDKTGSLVIPESLPEGIQTADASGPAVPLAISPANALQDMAADSEFVELQLPAQGSFSQGGSAAQTSSYNPAFPEDDAAAENKLFWDLIIEDAQTQSIPAGSRDTVRRYFEILRRE